MKQQITELEEKAYRLCHHEFEGLTIRETAIRMELREYIVRQLLKTLKQKAPQLFPILTKRQFLIYKLRLENGMSQQEIATVLGTSQSSIQAIIERMKKMGVTGLDINGVKTVRYDNSMDAHIKKKF